MDEPHICPPDHKHGQTSTCHGDHGCRCDDCKTAHREYDYWRTKMHETGHSDRLNVLVDATGARRRVEALIALGWSQSALARVTDMLQTHLSDVLTAPRLRRSTALRIAEIYDEYSHQLPPASTRAERQSISHAKGLARRRGYVPPLAWDDIDTDPHPPLVDDTAHAIDVVAVELTISGQRQSLLTVEERHQVVRVLHRHQHFDSVIAAACGVSVKTIERDREELGLPGIPQDGRNTREAHAA